MNTKNPEEIYANRIEQYTLRLNKLKKIETILAVIKLVFALGFIIVFYMAARAYSSIHLIVLISVAVLFTLVATHKKKK